MTGDIDSATFARIMEALPVEVSFVDADDVVRYFNKNGDRIFPRPKGVIGRKVQNCHPNKSIGKVENILEGFKKGTLDVAEFWIQLGEQKVYIRYFPVRDAEGKYIGCLEVSQDIAAIQKINGERRIAEEGDYLSDVDGLFQEAFYNGTIDGQTNFEIIQLMQRATFAGIQESINEKANKINANITFANPDFTVTQEDPWNVKFTLIVDVEIKDYSRLINERSLPCL